MKILAHLVSGITKILIRGAVLLMITGLTTYVYGVLPADHTLPAPKTIAEYVEYLKIDVKMVTEHPSIKDQFNDAKVRLI